MDCNVIEVGSRVLLVGPEDLIHHTYQYPFFKIKGVNELGGPQALYQLIHRGMG